ncbi:MAG: hypothetical protein H6822_31020 [Planctomycetaceae bacterium]|nr:hypothetical protein [Planctomycetales bacterium]MCB9926614.1 hypothetical protein [Planctomycetaceae bacterium]
MSRVFRSRSGALENTTFGILSPDGRNNLVTPGRGPMHAFRDAAAMASRMNIISLQYSGARDALWSDPRLPVMNSVDVALNVAACDNLPVIVTFSENDRKLGNINARILKAVWCESLAGQFVYATTANLAELKPIPGVKAQEGILVVEPGAYGLSGKILRELPADLTAEQATAELLQVVRTFSRIAPEYTSHIQLGIQLGFDWESAIPETDPQSIRAKERARGGR